MIVILGDEMSKFSPRALEKVYQAIGGKAFARGVSPDISLAPSTSPDSASYTSDFSLSPSPGLALFDGVSPKIRSAGESETSRYTVIASKSDLGGGTASGEIAVKKGSAKSHAPESPYHSPTMFKINEGEGNVRIQKDIQEVVAAHLLNLANWDSTIDDNPNFSKVFFGTGPDNLVRVGVRFHKDFKGLADIQNEGEKLDDIDCGKALAQTFWIGDNDGHNGNMGLIGDSKVAVRIDLDGAFSMAPLSSIIETGEENVDETYSTFRDSLSRESFATELERLGNIDFASPGGELEKLVSTIIASYKEHPAATLEPALEEKIRRNITDVIKRNSDQMKFLAQVAKINVILKKDGELTIDDRTKIIDASNQINILSRRFTEDAGALPRKVYENLGDIFALANTDLAKKHQALAIIEGMSPDLATKMGASCRKYCGAAWKELEEEKRSTRARAAAGAAAGAGAPVNSSTFTFKTYVPRAKRSATGASESGPSR